MRLHLGTIDVAAKWDAGPNPSLLELAEDRGLAPPHARRRGRIPIGPMKGLWEMPYRWTQLERNGEVIKVLDVLMAFRLSASPMAGCKASRSNRNPW